MSISDNWGQGSKNNDNGWGKGASNNSNGWGSIHANTYGHPTTNLTGEGGFVGLLDLVPNAAFATGMRLLRADYSGGILRIIAYDGATEQGAADIMPYKIGDNYWVDFNSKLENLDPTAIARGLTTNDTLADLCSVGVNNYHGLVPSWYDQSLNANHATQTSLAAMPKLVDAGVLVEENGSPGLQFNGSQAISANTTINIDRIFGFHVAKMLALSINETAGSINDIYLHWQFNNDYRFRYNVSDALEYTLSDFQKLFTSGFDGMNAFSQINDLSELTVPESPAGNGEEIVIGARRNDASSLAVNSIIQSSVIYNSDQSANRTKIKSNINNAYNIYP